MHQYTIFQVYSRNEKSAQMLLFYKFIITDLYNFQFGLRHTMQCRLLKEAVNER